MISTANQKAIFYNDRSVLENHHLASAWQILLKEDSNFLTHLSKEEFRSVRDQVVEMVLATDLSGHFAMLSAFKNKVLAAGTFNLDNKDDRNLFWKICIKCADVSNMAREWGLYERWLTRIMAEFFRQGDEEKKMGLQVSPFMDRETVQIPSAQISFLDFICLPSRFHCGNFSAVYILMHAFLFAVYETFTRVIVVPEIIATISKNRETLVDMRERDKKKEAATAGTAAANNSK
jgi:hypothetical protein